MKVMIGTLYSGENDFSQCCKSVKIQSVDCDHVVIEGLPETEAHEKLYRTFKDNGYDYLIKLDADMVFKSSLDAEIMINKSKKRGYWRVTYMVDDYFTGRAINGIHLFSSKVDWRWKGFKHNYLFPDRLDNAKRKGKTITKDRTLVWHCKYASKEQAFRYGYRRILKRGVIQCTWTLNNYLSNKKNRILRAACLGMLAATENRKHNISNLEKVLPEYLNREISAKYLRKKIKRMK